jgi:hypothetical protein
MIEGLLLQDARRAELDAEDAPDPLRAAMLRNRATIAREDARYYRERGVA